MKKLILFATLLALGTAQAEVLIGGVASKTLDTVQGGTTDNNWTLTDNGGPGSLASGETWTVYFKITVNSTSDGLAPAWQDSAEAIKIGFIDKSSIPTQGGGFELDLFGTPRVRVGHDASTGGAANFNLLSTTGSGLASGDVTGTTGDLFDVGDVGYFTYSVVNNGTNHNLRLVWSDGNGNETTASYDTTALPVYDSVERMSFRVSDFEGTNQTANLTVEMLEPPVSDGTHRLQFGTDVSWAASGMTGTNQIMNGSYTDTNGITFHVQAETAPGWTIPQGTGGLDVIGDGAVDSRIDGTEWIKYTVSVSGQTSKLDTLTVDRFSTKFLGGSNETFNVTDASANTVQIQELATDAYVTFDGALSGLDVLSLANIGTWSITFQSANTNTTGRMGAMRFVYTLKDAAAFGYDSWATDNGVTGGKNDDDDFDGMDNLLEFALGASPTNSDAASFLPVSTLAEAGGTNFLNYVYRRRLDTGTPGLTYSVVAGTDLVFNNITNSTTEAGGSGDLGDGFESVTNRVSTDAESQQFMKLNVQEN